MKIEGIIFDWAGTTVDYGCFAPVKAFMEIFKEYGIEVTMDETRKPMGMLKWDHIKTMLEMPRIQACWMEKFQRPVEKRDIDEMHDKFTANLMSILHEYTTPKPYVVETIQALRDAGFKIGSTTGYTDKMMEVVCAGAKQKGYEPDYWISPNGVNNMGRPYPYMIFKNIEALKITSIHNVVKVGDTISDIEEGKAAGVYTIGILEGSSIMALSEEEYDALSDTERTALNEKVKAAYIEAGADNVIATIKDLPALLSALSNE